MDCTILGTMIRTIVLNRDIKIVLEQLDYIINYIVCLNCDMSVRNGGVLFFVWFLSVCNQERGRTLGTWKHNLMDPRPTLAATITGPRHLRQPTKVALNLPRRLNKTGLWSLTSQLLASIQRARQLPRRKWSRCDNGSLSQVPSSLQLSSSLSPISSRLVSHLSLLFFFFHLSIQSLTLSLFFYFNLSRKASICSHG